MNLNNILKGEGYNGSRQFNKRLLASLGQEIKKNIESILQYLQLYIQFSWALDVYL